MLDSTLIVWFTLFGGSMLTVGCLVLWVYGTGKDLSIPEWEKPSDDITHKFMKLVNWFLLYGGLAFFAGLGTLITTIAMMVDYRTDNASPYIFLFAFVLLFFSVVFRIKTRSSRR